MVNSNLTNAKNLTRTVFVKLALWKNFEYTCRVSDTRWNEEELKKLV